MLAVRIATESSASVNNRSSHTRPGATQFATALWLPRTLLTLAAAAEIESTLGAPLFTMLAEEYDSFVALLSRAQAEQPVWLLCYCASDGLVPDPLSDAWAGEKRSDAINP